MKLRELINRLEELSDNGRNDDMEAVYDENYHEISITDVCIIDSKINIE